jgi:hypothetical protein
MPNLPRELFDLIASFLDIFDKCNMTDAFGVFGDENESNILWRSIFKDGKWLKEASDCGSQPVLIGSDLDNVATERRKRRSLYMVLNANDFSGDLWRAGLRERCHESFL